MFKQLAIVLLLCFGLTGCSLIPRITTDKPGVTPQSTSKSTKKESCSGDYKVDIQGNIISCSKGYQNYENHYSKAERAYTLKERIANFIRGLASWGVILLILAIFLIPGFGGWLIGTFFHRAKDLSVALVKGIQAGKAYVRSNGVNYTPQEREIYQKGADDFLKALDDAIDDKEVEKLLYKIRAELKYEK